MSAERCWVALAALVVNIAFGSCAQVADPCINKTRVADEKYCDKYWECAENGQSVQLDCPNGLVFAGENKGVLNNCDYPWKENYCVKPKIQINPPIKSPNCEWMFGIFKHLVPCARYWTCWNGTATEQYCAGDLWYSDISHSCEDTDNVKDCKDNHFPHQDVDYYYDDNDEAKLYEHKPRFKVKIISQSICDSHIPYNDSCEKYLHCNKGWPRIKKCPDGLVFDHDSLQCVTPPTKNCGITSTEEPSTDISADYF